MKKINVFLVLFFTLIVGMVSATLICNCPPVNPRPVFNLSADAAITPIPFTSEHPQISIQLKDSILAFAISPDQRSIAIGTSKNILLYDIKTFKQLRTITEQPSQFTLLDWSSDGKKLTIATLLNITDEPWVVHLLIFDTSTWQIIMDENKLGIDMSNEAISVLAWSPDNHSLAINRDRGVIVIDTQTRKITSRQNNFANGASSLTWSPDGTRLVGNGDTAKTLRRWKVSTDQYVRLFDKRLENAEQVAWSPDGTRIASANGGAICFWTAATNTCDGFIESDEKAALTLAWSSDGVKLATAGDAIRIWDTQTGKLLSAFGGVGEQTIHYAKIQWPTLNQPLITLQVNDYYQPGITAIRFWDVATGKILAEFIGKMIDYQ